MSVKLESFAMSSITHELRTPLTAIESAVNILNNELMGRPDYSPKEKRYIGMIQRNSQRLTHFIDNLLKTAQLENNTVTLDKNEGDLNETIKNSILLCQSLADEKGLKIVYQSKKNGLTKIDHNKIKQVFTNLISNAIKYSEKGIIRIHLHRNKKAVKISFSDQGEGILKKHREDIFQPFVQVSRKFKKTGVGLGLYIADKIMKLHGGKISVRSKGRGQGTTFIVEIPKREPNKAAHAGVKQRGKAPGPSTRDYSRKTYDTYN